MPGIAHSAPFMVMQEMLVGGLDHYAVRVREVPLLNELLYDTRIRLARLNIHVHT